MAKLIIDIPDDMLDYFMKEEYFDTDDGLNAIEYICNGTVLPKGHGAIKDVSQIEIPMCEDRSYEKWVQVAINSAPTIIEADREVEE